MNRRITTIVAALVVALSTVAPVASAATSVDVLRVHEEAELVAPPGPVTTLNVPVGDGGCTPGHIAFNIYGTGGVWYCTWSGYVRIG